MLLRMILLSVVFVWLLIKAINKIAPTEKQVDSTSDTAASAPGSQASTKPTTRARSQSKRALPDSTPQPNTNDHSPGVATATRVQLDEITHTSSRNSKNSRGNLNFLDLDPEDLDILAKADLPFEDAMKALEKEKGGYAELRGDFGSSKSTYSNSPYGYNSLTGGYASGAYGPAYRATTPPAPVTPTTSLFFTKLPTEHHASLLTSILVLLLLFCKSCCVCKLLHLGNEFTQYI